MSRFRVAITADLVEIVFDDGHMNVLSGGALAELFGILESIPHEAKLMTFRSGRDKLFAAGADMREMRTFSAAEAEAFSFQGQQLMRRFEQLPCVTAALIDGDCFGGALDLALTFDLRFASQRSRFSHPGARIGIVTGFGGTTRWRGRLSPATARELFLGNAIISADTAVSRRIIDGAPLPQPGQLLARARKMSRATLAAARRSAEMSLAARMLLAERLDDLYSAAEQEPSVVASA